MESWQDGKRGAFFLMGGRENVVGGLVWSGLVWFGLVDRGLVMP